MNTWTKETVPVLPTPTSLGRVTGAIRLVCLLVLTVVCVLLFLLGRSLRGVLGKWIAFHFTKLFLFRPDPLFNHFEKASISLLPPRAKTLYR